MAHFASTALFRKRTAEKRSEKHHEKTSKIHAKSDENSWPFRKSMADAIFHAFCSILAQFLEKNVLWDLPGRPWEAQGPSRGRPRGPWGGSRGALGAFRGRQNATWTPLGRPGHPQGPSRMDFPWIFDQFSWKSLSFDQNFIENPWFSSKIHAKFMILFENSCRSNKYICYIIFIINWIIIILLNIWYFL